MVLPYTVEASDGSITPNSEETLPERVVGAGPAVERGEQGGQRLGGAPHHPPFAKAQPRRSMS